MSMPESHPEWWACGSLARSAEQRTVDYWRLVIRRALMDCSTVDFHDISDEGVDNMALAAAQAVQRDLA